MIHQIRWKKFNIKKISMNFEPPNYWSAVRHAKHYTKVSTVSWDTEKSVTLVKIPQDKDFLLLLANFPLISLPWQREVLTPLFALEVH